MPANAMNSSYPDIKKYCDSNSAELVAVSKTKTPGEIMEIYNEGQRSFGENKVQEMLPKYEVLPKDIQWHLVGHLQTNKVKYIAPFISLIHSVDSWELLEEINKQASKHQRVIEVLLQLHIAREESKYGLMYDEARKILLDPVLNTLDNVCIKGMMGMATLTEDENLIRNEFKALKRFFDEMNDENPGIEHWNLDILSMGMTGDYKIAIEEGSNMVRIGTAIFGERTTSGKKN